MTNRVRVKAVQRHVAEVLPFRVIETPLPVVDQEGVIAVRRLADKVAAGEVRAIAIVLLDHDDQPEYVLAGEAYWHEMQGLAVGLLDRINCAARGVR